jgi:hypothetical protein
MTLLEIMIIVTVASSIVSCYGNYRLWRENKELIKARNEYVQGLQHYINKEARPQDLRYYSQWLDLKGWVQVGDFWTNKKDLGRERISTDEVIRRYISEVGNIKFT